MHGIYIVDDEVPVIRRLLDSIPWLEHGFEIVGHNTNPYTALEEITRLRPDAVITDLKMPGLGGLKLIAELKANGADAEYIMLSSFDDYPAVRDFFLMGGVDYILKPLDNDNAAPILEKLSRRLAEKHNQIPSVKFVPSQSAAFDELIRYVTENFNKKHTLPALSERFNLNSTYICDLFSKTYDSTLTIFITNIRMRTAARLIQENEVPMKEIAVFCGYKDYHQFAKAFKQHFNKPPSQYRDAAQVGN